MTGISITMGATLGAATTWWWVWLVAGVVAVTLLVLLAVELTHHDGRGFDR